MAALSEQLVYVHRALRERLTSLRQEATGGTGHRAADTAGPGALVRELDGFSAILESHFSYEERRMSKALDALGPGAWTADVFTPARLRPW